MPKDSNIKQYVFKLLGIKDRSEKELRQKLNLKGYKAALINETIKYFKDIGMVNDKILAESIVSFRGENRILGGFGCRQYLKKRGIPEDIVKEIIFPFEKEIEKANRIIDKKISHFMKYPEKDRFNKIYQFLYRRGFDSEVISDALRSRDESLRIKK